VLTTACSVAPAAASVRGRASCPFNPSLLAPSRAAVSQSVQKCCHQSCVLDPLLVRRAGTDILHGTSSRRWLSTLLLTA
jgi:hypothetical protein